MPCWLRPLFLDGNCDRQEFGAHPIFFFVLRVLRYLWTGAFGTAVPDAAIYRRLIRNIGRLKSLEIRRETGERQGFSGKMDLPLFASGSAF